MAYSTENLSFLLFLLTLLPSLHVHARDRQFFSKVSTNNNNNAKEIQLVPTKVEPLGKPVQDQNFIPQSQNAAYGLYGDGPLHLPPTTSTATTNEAPYNPNNNYHYNKEAYVTEPQGLSDTRFMDKGYTTPTSTNINYYNGGNMYSQQGMGGDTKLMDPTYNGGKMYNTQKQGMSDTRFLENGRYFYDLNNENFNLNAYENSRRVSRNGYNNRGYYGDNQNSYEYNNSIDEYQNQQESQQGQDDQYMP